MPGPKTKKQASLLELWLLSYPLIVTMGAQVFMQFVDRMFLAWHSHEALAACVPAGALAMTFASLFQGLANYTSVFISQFYAQKKYASVTVSLWQGVWLAILSAVILAALTPAGNGLISWFQHGEAVTALEKQYFTILNLFAGLSVVNNALSSFFNGRGRTLVTMWVVLIGNVINIGLDYVMIFGKLGFPQMGIAGAAWATVFGMGSMTLLFTGLMSTSAASKQFKLVKLAGFYKPIFARMIRFGVPNGFGYLLDVVSFTLFTFMVGSLGVVSLQASNIVMSMQPLVFMVILGLGMGIQILVSKYQGLKRPDLSVQVVKNACKIGYGYAGVVSLCFFCFSAFFVQLFIVPGSAHAAEITERALPLVKLVSFFVLFDATYLIFGEALRGAGDTRYFMKVMLVCAWGLLIPGTWVIVYQWHASVFWVWSWLSFYAGLTAVFMLIRFWRGKWKHIHVTTA